MMMRMAWEKCGELLGVLKFVRGGQIEGRAHFSKAAMLCPWLKYPITNLGGSVRLADGALMVRHSSPALL